MHKRGAATMGVVRSGLDRRRDGISMKTCAIWKLRVRLCPHFLQPMGISPYWQRTSLEVYQLRLPYVSRGRPWLSIEHYLYRTF